MSGTNNPTLYTEENTVAAKLDADVDFWAYSRFFSPKRRQESLFDTTIPIYGFNPQNLFNYFKSNDGTKYKIGIIDCRQQNAKDVEFKNACHVATNENSVGVQPQYDRLYQFKTEYPAQFNGLLESDWVIVHCAAGSNRSPPMTTAYAQMFSVAPKKNANQKIIFLKEGMDGYQKVDKKSEFLDPWNISFKYGPNNPKN